ncbi:unnamed protein product [Prorocentrum cordatum]|uniref:Uncharacterized protein n=1 Tax=Prorocentrum cordatum TaxID=2364126 RepID=A0ABN9USH8_9DINO|nr:unnamed protein product [Polarella glacialis]
MGLDWVVLGDFQMAPEVLLGQGWLRLVGGQCIAPTAATCHVAKPGSTIDFFLVSRHLVPRLPDLPDVDNSTKLWPHAPVTLALRHPQLQQEAWVRQLVQPRQLPVVPPVGCARFPWASWTEVLRSVAHAEAADQLAVAWDLVLRGITHELLDRHDIVTAWVIAARWSNHLAAVHKYLMTTTQRLQALSEPSASSQCQGPQTAHAPAHRTKQLALQEKLLKGLATALYQLDGYVRKIRQSTAVLRQLDDKYRQFLELGLDMFAQPGCHTLWEEIGARGAQQQKAAELQSQKSWQSWAKDAFLGGAGLAHRTSKVRVQEEVTPNAGQAGQPFEVADAEMAKWQEIWDTNQLAPLERPSQYDAWGPLPAITVEHLRGATRSFKASTARGPSRLAPRSLDQLSDEDACTILRSLVDDVTLQWAGQPGPGVRALARTTASFLKDLEALHLRVQRSKLGFVATERKVAQIFRGATRALRIPRKAWARNLGHEVFGTRPLRTQERRRLRALHARRRRLAMLRQAAGRRAARLQTTGLTPAVGHGAGVSGVAEGRLKVIRTAAGALAGHRPFSSLTGTLMTQTSARYDPLFAITTELVVRYAGWWWEGRASASDRQCAWSRAHAELQQDPSWARVRGPIAAVYLTLQRINWTMQAAHSLVDDIGCSFSLLDTAPRDILDALRQSIQRWQCRQLTQTLPEANGELLWPRAIDARLRGPRGVKGPKAQGALQCLWAYVGRAS